MPDREFDLLHEPWIMVMRQSGETEEVSLLALFRRAQDWRGLAGELPTQDVAVLRLLLAILHAVFARQDTQGADAPITTPDEALDRWQELWNMGHFPADVVEAYLRKYEERFWLFHPQYPFYQVPELNGRDDIFGPFNAAKMNGELAESDHKARLFSSRTGNSKTELTYAEAARWLLYANAYSETFGKLEAKGKKSKSDPSLGVCWLGKLGLLAACGDNLFETLLLNLVLLKDGGNELWGEERPIWEKNQIVVTERNEIITPNNPSELYTLQSRRLLLHREGTWVVGFSMLSGDFFSKENAFAEQMTIWTKSLSKKRNSLMTFNPGHHDPSRQMWRDFSTLVVQNDCAHRPGVINWIARLKDVEVLSKSHFRFQTASVSYGSMSAVINDVFSDSLSFNAALLTALGEHWVNRILAEIETTDKLAEQVGWLARSLALAASGDEGVGSEKQKQAKEQAYFLLDAPFRTWLEGIDPEHDQDDKDKKCDQWWDTAQKIVRALGRELAGQAGPQAFVGRSVTKNGKTFAYSVPQAFNYFLYCTSSREALYHKERQEVKNAQ